jgi:hypothetical protein
MTNLQLRDDEKVPLAGGKTMGRVGPSPANFILIMRTLARRDAGCKRLIWARRTLALLGAACSD